MLNDGTADCRVPRPSLSALYLTAIWLQGYYRRHHGVTEGGLAGAVQHVRRMDDSGNGTASAAVPAPMMVASCVLDQYRRSLRLIATPHSCCQSPGGANCESSVTFDPFQVWKASGSGVVVPLAAAEGGRDGAAPATVPLLSALGVPSSAMPIHRVINATLRLPHLLAQPTRVTRWSAHRLVTDDYLLCLSDHAALISSPGCIVVNSYATQRHTAAVPVDKNSSSVTGLYTLLFAPWCPEWRCVTIYNVADAADCHALARLLFRGALHPDTRGASAGPDSLQQRARPDAPKKLTTITRAQHWRELHLGELRDVPMKYYRSLLEVLDRQHCLTSVTLESCRLAPGEDLSLLLLFVSGALHLRRLSLRRNPGVFAPGTSAAASVGSACGRSSSLTSVDVSLCALTNAAFIDFCCSFAQHCGSRSRAPVTSGQPCDQNVSGYHMDVSNNSITAAVFEMLITASYSVASAVNSVADAVASSTVGPRHHVADLAPLLEYLVSLDLSGNPLAPPGLSSRGSAEAQRSSSALSRAANGRDQGGVSVNTSSTAATAATTVTPLHSLGALLLTRLPRLTRLRLNVCDRLGGASSASLWKRLLRAQCSNVTKNWGNPSLRPTGVLASEYINASDLSLLRPSLGDVCWSFGGCDLGPQDTKAILQQLRFVPASLTVALQLHANPLANLAASLSEWDVLLHRVVWLDLRTSALGGDGAFQLASAIDRAGLVQPLALEALYLCDNDLGSPQKRASKRGDPMPHLCRALRATQCPNLRLLHLSFNSISGASWRPLLSLIEQTGPIFCELNISGHELGGASSSLPPTGNDSGVGSDMAPHSSVKRNVLQDIRTSFQHSQRALGCLRRFCVIARDCGVDSLQATALSSTRFSVVI